MTEARDPSLPCRLRVDYLIPYQCLWQLGGIHPHFSGAMFLRRINTYLQNIWRGSQETPTGGERGFERDCLSLYTFLYCLHFVTICMYYLSREDENIKRKKMYLIQTAWPMAILCCWARTGSGVALEGNVCSSYLEIQDWPAP